MTYEINPPSTTFLFILDLPTQDGVATGGDTLFLSQVEAYNRLSPALAHDLEELPAMSTYESDTGTNLLEITLLWPFDKIQSTDITAGNTFFLDPHKITSSE